MVRALIAAGLLIGFAVVLAFVIFVVLAPIEPPSGPAPSLQH